jgi:hypothetical protein
VRPRTGAGSAAPGAALIARFQGFRRTTVGDFRGYELKVSSDGAWRLVAGGPSPATLASGRVPARHIYAMSLTTRSTTISARIDGRRVATVTSHAYRDGPAGLASLGYYPVRYPRFSVG